MEIDGMLNNITKLYTPEYLAELGKKCYEDDRNYPENFSNWYNHIVDFGSFKHAEIISNQVFTYEETEIMRETDNIKDVNWEKWYNILKPTLEKMRVGKWYSIKNGCFSNKFDFETSIVRSKLELAEKLYEINYASSLLDTGGYTELVVREYIPYNREKIATMYNGMPLREELRVFYNMDTEQIEYVVDYWDYMYCYDKLPNITDTIIFDYFHNRFGRQDSHKDKLKQMEDFIRDNISTLKFDNCLTGIWSIDFMYVEDIEEYRGIWLIDMARGFRSAYWDVDKLLKETKIKLLEENKNER